MIEALLRLSDYARRVRCLRSTSRQDGKGRGKVDAARRLTEDKECYLNAPSFPFSRLPFVLLFAPLTLFLSFNFSCRFSFLAVSCLLPQRLLLSHRCHQLSFPRLSSRELSRAGDELLRKTLKFAACFGQPERTSNYGGESVGHRGLGGRYRCSDRRWRRMRRR